MHVQPVGYQAVPWNFDADGEFKVGTEFKNWNKSTEDYWKAGRKLWFSDDVLDHIQWAYEGQREKLLALLSRWALQDKDIDENIYNTCLYKAIDGTHPSLDFLFEERVLFNNEPSIFLIQVLDQLKGKFIGVE